MLVKRRDDIGLGCSHFYRKGYYLGSDADYRCMLCGDEASVEEIAPIELDGRVDVEHD